MLKVFYGKRTNARSGSGAGTGTNFIINSLHFPSRLPSDFLFISCRSIPLLCMHIHCRYGFGMCASAFACVSILLLLHLELARDFKYLIVYTHSSLHREGIYIVHAFTFAFAYRWGECFKIEKHGS